MFFQLTEQNAQDDNLTTLRLIDNRLTLGIGNSIRSAYSELTYEQAKALSRQLDWFAETMKAQAAV